MSGKCLYMFAHLCATHKPEELAETYAQRGAEVALNEGRNQTCGQFWGTHYYGETMSPLYDYYRDPIFEGFSRGVQRFAMLHWRRGWIEARRRKQA